VDNSLPRVLAHTHRTTTAALSLRISMVDPVRTLRDLRRCPSVSRPWRPRCIDIQG
jgi:hypothetical protein